MKSNTSYLLLTVIFIYLMFSPPAQAASYYVDKQNPAAADTNPGTMLQPWQTLAKAGNAATAGDTVFIRSGVYEERLIPAASGTPGNYITYTSYPGETVILDGTNVIVPPWSGLILISNKSYITISGLYIQNVMINGAPLNEEYKHTGIWVGNSHHINIENNYFYNTCGSGVLARRGSFMVISGNEFELNCNGCKGEIISLEVSNDIEVMNNYIHHGGLGYISTPPAAAGGDGGEGIDVKEGSYNVKVHHNVIHDLVEDMGIYIDAYDKHTYNIEVWNNIVYNSREGLTWGCEQGGLLENLKVHHNIAYNNSKYGFNIGGFGVGPRKNIEIYNNLSFKNDMGGMYATRRDYDNITIINNILSQNELFQLRIVGAEEEFSISHNIIDGFRGYADEKYGDNPIVGDPRFVDGTFPPYDFHLLPSSPAIDAGMDVGLLVDFDGASIPQGAAPDIGPYETAGDHTPGDDDENVLVIVNPAAGAVWSGKQRIVWFVNAPGSPLTIALYYASAANAAAGNWTLIADQLTYVGEHLWDTTVVGQSGLYQIKVVAAGANMQPGEAVSGQFTINTAVGILTFGPNPANDSVTFYFGAGLSGTLYVYDAAGRQVWSAQAPPGVASLTWNLTNMPGQQLANGLYFCLTVKADGSRTAAQRLVIAR